MSCINKNSQEFKQLLEDSGLPSIVLEAKIVSWQNKKGIEIYPSLEDLNLKKQNINLEIKPSVTELFESNPELANAVYSALGFNYLKNFDGNIDMLASDIASSYDGAKKASDFIPQIQKDLQQVQQLYSQYLDTIFPDSKVKNIVYRGKTDSQTNQKSKELGIFFTDDKNAANIYAVKYKGDEFDDSIIQGIVNKFGLNPTIEEIKSEIAFFEKMGATKEQIEKDAKKFQNYILNNRGTHEQVILNIKNPKNLTVKDWFDNYDNSSNLKENSDGLLLKGGKQSNNRIYDAGENQIVVFEPEQIHILGSKQDIKGFKEFVDNKQNIQKESSQKEFFETGEKIKQLENNSEENKLYVIKNDKNNESEEKMLEQQLKDNKQLLFGGKPIKKATVSEVLKNIIENEEQFTISDLAFYLEKVMNLQNKSGAVFQILSDENYREIAKNKDNSLAVMVFDPTNNHIYTSNEILKKYSTTVILESFIHEISHSTTVKAYIEANSPEQRAFKQFIDDAFEQFKFLAEKRENNKLSYGFTNPLEFIAEIYSNPAFRNELELLEQGFFDKLINFIRRLFNLPKTIKNNEFIKASILFETVEKFTEKDTFKNWKGTINFDSRYDSSYYKTIDSKIDLTTLEKKLQDINNKMLISLKDNIVKFEKFSNRFTENTALAKYVKNLKDLKTIIEDYQNVNKIKSVTSYLKQMSATLNYISNKIEKADLKNPQEIEKVLKSNEEYVLSFSIIKNIQGFLTELEEEPGNIVTQKELEELKALVSTNSGKYDLLKSKIADLKKKFVKNMLTDLKYHPDIEKKHYERLVKEHRDNKVFEEKETWIRDKFLNRDKDIIDSDVKQRVAEIIENPLYDIYSPDVNFQSAFNVSSPMISIFNLIMQELDNKRIEEERKKDIEMLKLFDKLVLEKGSNDIKKLYSNILEKSKTGQPILKGEYSVKLFDIIQEIESLRTEKYLKLKEIGEKTKGLEENSLEYKELIKEKEKLEKQYDDKISKLKADNFDIVDNEFKPKDKFKNNLNNLSKTELEVLNYFKKIIDDGAKKTFYHDTLTTKRFGAVFYELPKITKTDAERIWTGETSGMIKDKWQNLTQTRPDDIGYVTKQTDYEGKVINEIPVHYRDKYNNFDHSMQSLDLFNIFKLEYQNTNAYKYKTSFKNDLQYLIDVAENKSYYRLAGTTIVKSTKTEQQDIKPGLESNTVKMMKNMMESKFYDIMRINGVKLNSVDVNKIVDYMNGGTAFLGLSLNVASGTANILNAQAQIFLESFIKGHFIKSKGVAKANKMYGEDLPNILKDLTNGIQTSLTNQINSYFDVRGDFGFTNSNFLRSSMLKYGFNTEALQVFQNSGEHWIQSTITMAVLDGLKVYNEKGEYLNKEGKVVTKYADAASLLDMLYKDKDGLLQLKEEVVYTDHSRFSKWNEGGKEKVQALIIKKIYDSVGNYRQTDQPELMRHWYGRLVMLYRRFLVPMGLSRLRGIETSLKTKEQLEEKDKRFSYALQEYEEGTYTTLVRYIKSSIKGFDTFNMFISNYKDMTDYEKHNLKRASLEIIAVNVLGVLSAMLYGAAAEDDDELLYFVAYQLRRLDTELSAYWSIRENFKMLRSPIPSLRLTEHMLWSTNMVLNPFKWDDLTEEYVQGRHKGENKFLIKQQKHIPIVRDFLRSYEDYYNFQNQSWGGSFGN